MPSGKVAVVEEVAEEGAGEAKAVAEVEVEEDRLLLHQAGAVEAADVPSAAVAGAAVTAAAGP